jgi:hypothetical protein
MGEVVTPSVNENDRSGTWGGPRVGQVLPRLFHFYGMPADQEIRLSKGGPLGFGRLLLEPVTKMISTLRHAGPWGQFGSLCHQPANGLGEGGYFAPPKQEGHHPDLLLRKAPRLDIRSKVHAALSTVRAHAQGEEHTSISVYVVDILGVVEMKIER